jgi:hypothetical protein
MRYEMLIVAQSHPNNPCRRYFFELTTSPNVIWVDLNRLALKSGSPVLMLDPDNIELSRDVTKKFKKQKKSPF